MKHLLTLLLICCSFSATAQTYRAATTTSTAAPLSYNKAGVDTLIAQLSRRVQALESRVVFLRPGTVDSLNRLNVLLTDLSTRIAQQGASLSTLNATLSAAVAVNNSQALQLSGISGQLGQQGITIQQLQQQVKAAQDAANAAQGTVDNLKNYLKALP